MDDMTREAQLVARLEDAARRWWVPTWLSDLLIQAAARIETQGEMERLLRWKISVLRDTTP